VQPGLAQKGITLEEEYEIARCRVEDAARHCVGNPDEPVYLIALRSRLTELDRLTRSMRRRGLDGVHGGPNPMDHRTGAPRRGRPRNIDR
jgi:hypothetical protein